MPLKTVSVSKCLDKKLLLLGYEIPDLLALLILLSVLNFFFGSAQLKIFFVWIPTLTLAITLRIGKRGKPDNFLVHWFKFQSRPKHLQAFPEPSVSKPLKNRSFQS